MPLTDARQPSRPVQPGHLPRTIQHTDHLIPRYEDDLRNRATVTLDDASDTQPRMGYPGRFHQWHHRDAPPAPVPPAH